MGRKGREAAALLLVLAVGTAGAAAPASEALPGLAAAFHEALKGRTVRTPDGSEPSLADGPAAVLTPERVVTCLSAISESESWPSAWLVVQDQSRTYDVVLRVRLGADGRIESPETVFAVTRREWDERTLGRAFQEAVGRKLPRERARNLVVQSFVRRTLTRYVYETPTGAGEARGLMALLPAGSILREAKAVDLGDGQLHTLAVVLAEAAFEPSDCEGDLDTALAHADSGRLIVVLAGESRIEDRLELDALLAPAGERILLPRYACEPEDERAGALDLPPGERFRGREMVRLLDPRDLDGDGRALEIAFTVGLARSGGGDFELRRVVLDLAPRDRKLRLVSVSPLSR